MSTNQTFKIPSLLTRVFFFFCGLDVVLGQTTSSLQQSVRWYTLTPALRAAEWRIDLNGCQFTPYFLSCCGNDSI